jgi:hypothetical protein
LTKESIAELKVLLASFNTGATSEGEKVQPWDKSSVANHEAPAAKQFLGAGTIRSGKYNGISRGTSHQLPIMRHQLLNSSLVLVPSDQVSTMV